MGTGSDRSEALSVSERARLEALRNADGLADLIALTGIGSDRDAYFRAKDEWFELRGKELAATDHHETGLPGNAVDVHGTVVHVHGITHADTHAERSFLRRHVDGFLEDGAAVYCEQGIRSMYFPDRPAVCEMDDYRWAMAACEDLDGASHAADVVEPGFDGLAEDVDALTTRFRDAAFSLIDSGSQADADAFRSALGDVASALLTGHADLATGEDFTSFAKSRRAARDPSYLLDLQQYYERRFLPQPVEREWLRRHDPELELVTHARNGRMADYAVYHADGTAEMHLIVGAAHQPGVTYYLRQHRDGERSLEGFELVG